MSGSPVTAAAVIPRGTRGRCLLTRPASPTTVPVYDPSTGTGRMLALDLDPAHAARDGDNAAVRYHHQRGGDATTEVSAQAEALVGT